MQFCRISPAALAATRLGSGDRLIVPVHGWTCRRSHWAGQLALMSRYGEVLALDLPGHGDSASSAPEEATVTGLARGLATVVQAEAAGRPVVLVGHSMGGAVALEAACLLPGTAAVVLVDTFVIPYGDLPEDQAAAIEQGFRDDFVGAMRNLVDSNTRDDLPAPLRDLLHHDMASADPAWALPLWADLLRWQPDAALRGVGVPVHAINGSLVGEAARQRCQAAGVSEDVIEAARHFPQLETVALFNDRLEAALQRLCR